MSSTNENTMSNVEVETCTCTAECCPKCVSVTSLEDELKLTEEKYVQILDQVKAKSEELSKLKEHALVLSGARSVLMKVCQK